MPQSFAEMLKQSPEMQTQLREAYEKALAKNEDIFTWQSLPFFTGYVRYLLEYCETEKTP